MKKIIKVTLIALIVSMNFSFVGCDKKNIANEVLGVLNSNKNSIIFDEQEIKKDEVLAYESPYKDACTTYYKDKLSGEELELYNTFIYAYEHGYEKIKYYSSNENLGDSFKKVVQSLSAENPFIDWNQEYTYTYFAGCYEFESTQLSRKDVQLKIEAYNKAKNLIQSMPKNFSSYQKVLWIYNYVVNNVKYVDDLYSYLDGEPAFIYDALIGGKTQCSGFADTMTMMCNLAGIQTLTICGQTDEGHAWNLVNLDGDFYYCDATSDSSIKDSIPAWGKDLNLSFLKSEEVFSSNGYKIMDDTVIEFPKAVNNKYDNDYIDFNLNNLSNQSELNSIAKKLMKERKYVVVHVKHISLNDSDEYNDAAQYILDYICNNMTSSVYNYVTIENLISEGSNDIIFYVNFEK